MPSAAAAGRESIVGSRPSIVEPRRRATISSLWGSPPHVVVWCPTRCGRSRPRARSRGSARSARASRHAVTTSRRGRFSTRGRGQARRRESVDEDHLRRYRRGRHRRPLRVRDVRVVEAHASTRASRSRAAAGRPRVTSENSATCSHAALCAVVETHAWAPHSVHAVLTDASSRHGQRAAHRAPALDAIGPGTRTRAAHARRQQREASGRIGYWKRISSCLVEMRIQSPTRAGPEQREKSAPGLATKRPAEQEKERQERPRRRAQPPVASASAGRSRPSCRTGRSGSEVASAEEVAQAQVANRTQRSDRASPAASRDEDRSSMSREETALGPANAHRQRREREASARRPRRRRRPGESAREEPAAVAARRKARAVARGGVPQAGTIARKTAGTIAHRRWLRAAARAEEDEHDVRRARETDSRRASSGAGLR